VTGLALLGSRSSFQTERQVSALAIANERLEKIRALSYENVGYTNASALEPDGVILRHENITQDSGDYVVDTTIELIDDPANGTLAQGLLNEETADYKK